MISTTLDAIVRDAIMRKGYTIHWYIPFMVSAKNCLRELSLDDLKVINTKKLPVGNYNEVDLPNDYLDYAHVNVAAGQNIRPLVETSRINSLINYNNSFEPVLYSQNQVSETSPQPFYGYLYPFYFNTVTYNEFGESIGRFYGFGAGVQDDTFKIVPERNQIQLTEHLSADFIILEYISDGMNSDSATRIPTYASETISAYINWQLKENSRSYGLGDRQLAEQEYIKQRKILRARMSGLTLEVLKRISQKSSYASPKSA